MQSHNLTAADTLDQPYSYVQLESIVHRPHATQSSKDFFRTYVRMPKEHNSQTTPVAVGVEMTAGFLEKAPLLRNNLLQLGELADTGSHSLPNSPTACPQLRHTAAVVTSLAGTPCPHPCVRADVPNGDGTFFNYTSSQHIDFEFPGVGANPFRWVPCDVTAYRLRALSACVRSRCVLHGTATHARGRCVLASIPSVRER